MNQNGPRNLLPRTPLAQTVALFLCYWLAWKAAALFEVQPHVSALYLSAGLSTAVGMIGGWPACDRETLAAYQQILSCIQPRLALRTAMACMEKAPPPHGGGAGLWAGVVAVADQTNCTTCAAPRALAACGSLKSASSCACFALASATWRSLTWP